VFEVSLLWFEAKAELNPNCGSPATVSSISGTIKILLNCRLPPHSEPSLVTTVMKPMTNKLSAINSKARVFCSCDLLPRGPNGGRHLPIGACRGDMIGALVSLR
jgi:hypothetical protein